MSEDREIFLFQNIRQVILAETWCVENKLEVKVIPVPRPYSSECGMCLEVSLKNGDRLQKYAEEQAMITKRVKG
jgi:hypothetical protein